MLKLTLTPYEAACIELFLLHDGGPTYAAHNRIINKIDRARWDMGMARPARQDLLDWVTPQ